MVGVPLRFVVIDVIAAANAVMSTKSQLSVLIVGVALLLIDVMRGVTRLLVRVSVDVRPTMVSVALGIVSVVPSVPASVSVLLTDSVLPLVMVNVPVVVLIVKPLRLVAVATPSVGVTSVGDVARTDAPDPVTVVVPTNKKSHDAAVVPLVRIQDTIASPPASTVPIKLPPDELTVTLPVELLWMIQR